MSAVIALLYTLLGGLISVAYTDVVQMFFIVFGLVSDMDGVVSDRDGAVSDRDGVVNDRVRVLRDRGGLVSDRGGSYLN